MQKSQFFNRPARIRNARGFTLIELMVVVAIVGILASLAYPSFMSQVRKSRRSDAAVSMSSVQQAQERWRANKTAYASNTEMTTAVPNGLGLLAITDGGYYTLTVSNNTATSYALTATAVSTKSQIGDTGCTSLVITVTNGNDVKTPAICWSK